MVFQIVQRTVPSWPQHPDYIEACRTIGHPGELGRYAVPRDSGQPPNRTDFQYGGSHWSPTNLPSIMYMLWPCQAWNDWKGSAKPGQKLDANGQLMIERHPRPGKVARKILDWPILKDINKISTEVEWWYIEILFRLEPRLTWRDIDMRMELTLDRRRVQKPAFINLLGMRCSRGREEWGLVAWSDQAESSGERPRQSVYDRLRQAGVDITANSTAAITPGGAAFLPAAAQPQAPAPLAPPANAAAATTQSQSAASSTSRSISNSANTVSDPSSPDYPPRHTRRQQRGHPIVRAAPKSIQKLPSKTTASRTLRSTLPNKAKNTRSYSLGSEDSPSPRRMRKQGLARERVDHFDAGTETFESGSGAKRRRQEPQVSGTSGARRKAASKQRPRDTRRDSTESSQAYDEPLGQRQPLRRHQTVDSNTNINISMPSGYPHQAPLHTAQMAYEQPSTSFVNKTRPGLSNLQNQRPEQWPSYYGPTNQYPQQYGSLEIRGPGIHNIYPHPQHHNVLQTNANNLMTDGGNEYYIRDNRPAQLPFEHRFTKEIGRSQSAMKLSMHYPAQGHGQTYDFYRQSPRLLPSSPYNNRVDAIATPGVITSGNRPVFTNTTSPVSNGPGPAGRGTTPAIANTTVTSWSQTPAGANAYGLEDVDLTSPNPSDWQSSRHQESVSYQQANSYATSPYGAAPHGTDTFAAPSYAPSHNQNTNSAGRQPYYDNELMGGASLDPPNFSNEQWFAPRSVGQGRPKQQHSNVEDQLGEGDGGDSGPASGS